jgi:hypothetical protein
MMITRYNYNHKAYRLVDIDTNKVSFNRDVVVDGEVEPFHTSPKFKFTKQPVVDKDSGVKLQAAPPEGREDPEHKESSRLVFSDADSPNQHSNDTDTGEDEENPKKETQVEALHHWRCSDR